MQWQFQLEASGPGPGLDGYGGSAGDMCAQASMESDQTRSPRAASGECQWPGRVNLNGPGAVMSVWRARGVSELGVCSVAVAEPRVQPELDGEERARGED
eukprot:578437-Rhodomonas_salina.2